MGLCEGSVDDTHAGKALLEGLKRLNTELGIPRLRDCVPTSEREFESHLQKMAGDALASGSPQNNPVVPTAEEIIELYCEAW
jgi:alcohol dehydrogenase class IV